MAVILVRIDDRLIHGQIIEGWLKPLEANHILVVSDEVAKDKMQQILLGMAVPSGVTLTIAGAKDAAESILSGSLDKKRVLVLVPSPKYVLELVNYGAKFTSVNVGGMHYSSGKKQIMRTLSVNDEDIEAIMALNSKGMELEGRVLPDDDKVNIMDVLRKELKINE